MMPPAKLLDVRGLRIEAQTSRGPIVLVDDVSIDVGPGEIHGLVGESGSGKTLTSLSVMGLQDPRLLVSGHIEFDDRDLLELPEKQLNRIRGNDLAMIFQESALSLNPAFTVGEQIAETVRAHYQCGRRRARERALEVLRLVRIPGSEQRLDAYPHEFSGGMRQRVAIAMAIACEPRLLIADEPTTALDVTVQSQILALLLELRTKLSMGMLFITHDLGVVAQICDRVSVMYAGQVVESADVLNLFRSPRHPYTEALLAAIPRIHNSEQKLNVLPGVPPRAGQRPSGCAFRNRCAYDRPCCAEPLLTLPQSELSATGMSHYSRCIRSELTLRGTRDI